MPVVDMARAAQARGLRALTLPEHTHVPVAATDVMPRYQRTLDPYIAAAFIAATTDLEVGTGVSLIAQHDAIALAKAIATLDHLSGGRVMVGVGYGYSREEAADHGIPVSRRAAVVEETVRLMRALWTEDEAEFTGEHRSVSRSRAWPKPTRPGGPPILLGAATNERTFERIVDWADGWIPMGVGILDDGFATNLGELRKRWSDAGRAEELQVCTFFMPGSVDDMAREVERAVELGIQRSQVYLEDRDTDAALPILDDLAAVVERVGA
jgi:probable F420-dependent oxidoreductase